MKKRSVFFVVSLSVFTTVCFQLSSSFALEKVALGTGTKGASVYYLPIMAAQEKGYFKENGLAVEYSPFSSTDPMLRAAAAGHLNLALNSAAGLLPAMGKGVPVQIVSHLSLADDFVFWVRTESRLKEPKDLKGAKVGVARFGGTQHVYARVVVNSLGLDKDVTFVSTGGPAESMGALKTGVIDAYVMTLPIVVNLRVAGEIRQLASAADYRPKPWVGFVLFARKDFAKNNPQAVKGAINGLLAGAAFVQKNPSWALAKMKAESAYSEEAARLIYEFEAGKYSSDGKIDQVGLENVRNFLTEYGVASKSEIPAVEELFTNEFTR